MEENKITMTSTRSELWKQMKEYDHNLVYNKLSKPDMIAFLEKQN